MPSKIFRIEMHKAGAVPVGQFGTVGVSRFVRRQQLYYGTQNINVTGGLYMS